MSIKQLRGKSSTDLSAQLLELRREQFNLRMQKGAGQLTQTHQVRKVRRDIARIKGLLGDNK
ncbi:50S ribosomal protein L29 [Xanthomonadaceae bacterium JHOS43]|nr:50S ribosomal protein L29 [Xanthomonadaceae bacterium JHOS43]MCX7563181.1 50S ribosomal protein L29 [Xanthomonadaceae bacterium XH05]